MTNSNWEAEGGRKKNSRGGGEGMGTHVWFTLQTLHSLLSSVLLFCFLFTWPSTLRCLAQTDVDDVSHSSVVVRAANELMAKSPPFLFLYIKSKRNHLHRRALTGVCLHLHVCPGCPAVPRSNTPPPPRSSAHRWWACGGCLQWEQLQGMQRELLSLLSLLL